MTTTPPTTPPTAAPRRPPMPRMPGNNKPTPPKPPTKTVVKFTKPHVTAGYRTILYGPGGIGKTTFAAYAPGNTVFIDLDDSLSRLRDLPEVQVVDVQDWADLRNKLDAEGWDGVDNIVLDTGTRAEELAVEHTLATVKHEKGHSVNSIEGYGYGKGYMHVFDTFLLLLGDLNRHARAGRNVVIICHDCTTEVPNPMGDNWLRYEPRLQSPNSGKGSIRLRIREWADHMLFLGYDVAVTDGKGKGAGTRTLYPTEMPHCMAKNRGMDPYPIPVTIDEIPEIWNQILGK